MTKKPGLWGPWRFQIFPSGLALVTSDYASKPYPCVSVVPDRPDNENYYRHTIELWCKAVTDVLSGEAPPEWMCGFFRKDLVTLESIGGGILRAAGPMVTIGGKVGPECEMADSVMRREVLSRYLEDQGLCLPEQTFVKKPPKKKKR